MNKNARPTLVGKFKGNEEDANAKQLYNLCSSTRVISIKERFRKLCKRKPSKRKTTINVKQIDLDEEEHYPHKHGHIFLKTIISCIRMIGTILWCIYFDSCARNSSESMTFLTLPGMAPADILIVVEFIVRKERPFCPSLAHDIIGIVFGIATVYLLSEYGQCEFRSKGPRFIPTSIIVCTMLHVFHLIMFCATTSSTNH